MSDLNAIRPVETLARSVAAPRALDSEASPGAGSFGERVAAAIEQTDRLLAEGDRVAQGVADGSADAVEALITLSKAELALRHVVAMSTRALDAYREVMRMQL